MFGCVGAIEVIARRSRSIRHHALAATLTWIAAAIGIVGIALFKAHANGVVQAGSFAGGVAASGRLLGELDASTAGVWAVLALPFAIAAFFRLQKIHFVFATLMTIPANVVFAIVASSPLFSGRHGGRDVALILMLVSAPFVLGVAPVCALADFLDARPWPASRPGAPT